MHFLLIELPGQLVEHMNLVGSRVSFDKRMHLGMLITVTIFLPSFHFRIVILIERSNNFKVIDFKNQKIMENYSSRVPLVMNKFYMDHNLHNF